jgi:hypothetical protein
MGIMGSIVAPLPSIHTLRGQKVVLDADLAELYQVSIKAFNQAVRRNHRRFPKDFVFKLTPLEVAHLRSQFVTLDKSAEGSSLRSQIVTLKNRKRGQHRKYLPFAFTEHGAVMAAMVLRSERAMALSVYVIRAFLRMRDELTTSAAILQRVAEIDRHLLEHDTVLRDIYEKLEPLIEASSRASRPKIGFHEGNR